MVRFHSSARRSRYSIISGILNEVSIWISGIGTWPKNALRASHRRTVLSFPMDQSMPRFLKLAYASRRMCTLRASRASRCSSSPNIRVASKPLQDLCDALVDREGARIERELGRNRGLVRIVDPREVLDFPAARAGVQTLDVAPLAHIQRGRHVDLDEAGAESPDEIAALSVRRHERCHHGHPVRGQPARHVPRPAQVLLALG